MKVGLYAKFSNKQKEKLKSLGLDIVFYPSFRHCTYNFNGTPYSCISNAFLSRTDILIISPISLKRLRKYVQKCGCSFSNVNKIYYVIEYDSHNFALRFYRVLKKYFKNIHMAYSYCSKTPISYIINSKYFDGHLWITNISLDDTCMPAVELLKKYSNYIDGFDIMLDNIYIKRKKMDDATFSKLMHLSLIHI